MRWHRLRINVDGRTSIATVVASAFWFSPWSSLGKESVSQTGVSSVKKNFLPIRNGKDQSVDPNKEVVINRKGAFWPWLRKKRWLYLTTNQSGGAMFSRRCNVKRKILEDCFFLTPLAAFTWAKERRVHPMDNDPSNITLFLGLGFRVRVNSKADWMYIGIIWHSSPRLHCCNAMPNGRYGVA